ncbi:DUF4380 domain-containing protein [Tessaracoccus antarcticus]|uniref:DUF4380 domain-containing protein n=1 Tax=Tessaracoccus antarcticus TaxID=2479848 RepID=A0A3M0G9X7_9ACTN|nr:DUF4380 domain-containing protein [Tessaracoccus antarcticus]RMB61795.1 DUF4380 domain-containing protein [Tessaracoccus antarcticus]
MSSQDVVWLQAGTIRLGVMPRLGGRMVSMCFGGHEFLWRNPALLGPKLELLAEALQPLAGAGFSDWQNWGGDKTWPAPQGWSGPDEWPGPPDAVLDAGHYRILEKTRDRVVMESGFDSRSGLRIRRDLHISPDESVSVTATLTNETSRRVRWATWGVTQLAFDARDVRNDESAILVDVIGREEPRVLFAPLGEMAYTLSQGVVRVPFGETVGKIGFRSPAGRVRLQRSGQPTLILDFDVATQSVYPDDCPFQLWMQTDHGGPLPGLDGLEATARLVEFEPLSPLTDLDPDESVTLTSRWSVKPAEPTSQA